MNVSYTIDILGTNVKSIEFLKLETSLETL